MAAGCKSELEQQRIDMQQAQPEEQKEDHIGERIVRISPLCIEAREVVGEGGILTDYIKGCKGSGATLQYWVNGNEDLVTIRAQGALTNPSIFEICVPFDGCMLWTDSAFAHYLDGAKKAWEKQCERFNCKELEEKQKNGEYIPEPFEF